MNSILRIAGFSALLAGALGLGCRFLAWDDMEESQGLQSLKVPESFVIQQVAGPDLISYPMMATLDSKGRLYVSESTGPNTMTTEEMLEAPSYRIRVLEDLDDDGVYDRSHVFADNLPLPQGGTFFDGALFVSAAPDLLRLEDTDGDGTADRREVVLTGWTLNVNGAVLHGPFQGPDGWLYLADARRSYRIQTKEGTLLEGKGGRIWRCRTDGTGLEVVSAGGFDNPVELVFTPAGETIGTMTYFVNPHAGQRDALMHWVEGGVYPKPHPVIQEDGLKQTGELMPVMTKFARVAPAGLVRYRGSALGAEYQGNLFSAQFNTHRVLRHSISRTGATFQTEDEDFLTSSDPNFHPTDVLEDADGSLLVLDTGGWFIQGCPLSRITKPEFHGGVYRIRRKDSPRVDDARGQGLQLKESSPTDLVGYLDDPRSAVRDRAIELLVQAQDLATAPLLQLLQDHPSAEVGCAAVFALFRIGTPASRKAVRSALDNPEVQVRIAAARAAGLGQDQETLARLSEMVEEDEPPVRRQAATALAQLGDRSASGALLRAASNPDDRFVEHAIIHALISLADPAVLRVALTSPSPKIRKAALIALDQMDGRPLQQGHLVASLDSEDAELRKAALWVATHRPEWAEGITNSLRASLGQPLSEADQESVSEVLLGLCENPPVQRLIAQLMKDRHLDSSRRTLLLESMEECPLEPFPELWVEPLRELLQKGEPEGRSQAVSLVRSRGLKHFANEFTSIAQRTEESPELRLSAIDALIMTHPQLSQDSFDFVFGQLGAETNAPLRQLAASTLARSDLTDDQLLKLTTDYLPKVDPLLLPRLLEAFAKNSNEKVGLGLVAALSHSAEVLDSLAEGGLHDLFATYPESVQEAAQPLTARLRELRNSRLERLESVLGQLKQGDVGRGRKLFFGNTAACSSCHTIGIEGGEVGPDLTSVGAIRSRHDLLEAIMFPSASFVRQYESFRVETALDVYSGLIVRRTPELLVLVTGADSKVRIPQSEVVSMERSSISLMPEGLNEELTLDELSDLMAFLQAQTQRPSEVSTSAPTANVGTR